MWIEAIVSLEDFQSLAAELLPVRVQLGASDSDHYLFLSAAREVSLLEGRGLRVVCSAQIRWPVLGMDLPINVDNLTVVLEPSVAQEGGELLIGMQLEQADVAWVPSVLDSTIVSAINEAVRNRSSELSWSFGVMNQNFALPPMLQPLRALDLKAGWGKVRITSEAMVLVVSFHAHAVARSEMQEAARRAEDASAPRSSALAPRQAGSDRPSTADLALGTTLALVATYTIARFTYRLVAGSGRYRFA